MQWVIDALWPDGIGVRFTGDPITDDYRELIEQVASDAYDAEGPTMIMAELVTSEALARVMRSA